MQALGINIGKIQTEYSPGQFEYGINPSYGIKAADAFFMFKYGVKEMSARNDMDAIFMTVPDSNGCGNASHFNHSLWYKTGESAMYDASKPECLSDVARYWLGGLCKHVNAITALCSPTVNCYRRLHQIWVPDTPSWGIDDRVSTYRVKNYSPSSTLIENRIASGSCNPYLVMAANVAAGIDGIVNKIECPPPSQTDGPKIPYTLQEALKALQEDTVMVEALGKQFVDWFSESKKQVDFKICEKSRDPKGIKTEYELYSKYM